MRILIIITFVFYWLITLLYVSPSNFIRINFQNQLHLFEYAFSQKWAFFAPPPQRNVRLFYTYHRQDSTPIITLEVLEYLLEQKKEKQPWNTKEEALDYMVNGSIDSILNTIIRNRKRHQSNYPDSTSVYCELLARGEINASSDNIPAYQTLIKFGKIVAKKNMEETDLSEIAYFKMSIREIKLPKFVDRKKLIDQSGPPPVQGLLLDSESIPYN